MKIVRFLTSDGQPNYGRIDGENIYLIDTPFSDTIKMGDKPIAIDSVRIVAPSAPSKIILVGLNYKEHARELGMELPTEPIIFMKPPSAVIGHLADIIYPSNVAQLDYEAELACVIKKRAHRINAKEAGDYILGYTCLNDVTARDLQKKDGQWTRAKSFDTFCPVGPHIETEIDPRGLKVELVLNGNTRQRCETSDMIFSPEDLVAFISRVMTLFPGDIISTGTPKGVGPMVPGDEVEVQIEGIGVLRNKVMPSPK
ncbi:MAG: fumarylacetoacetate hydrolase family protein [Candidatus Omnitrophica bacterium]|nr:fumarylacetoacetate hydrolase family protein [Candidatus Omnitrophota bacterium]